MQLADFSKRSARKIHSQFVRLSRIYIANLSWITTRSFARFLRRFGACKNRPLQNKLVMTGDSIRHSELLRMKSQCNWLIFPNAVQEKSILNSCGYPESIQLIYTGLLREERLHIFIATAPKYGVFLKKYALIFQARNDVFYFHVIANF